MTDLVYCGCVAGCVFCRIIAGEAPARIVHEDDDVLAFLDIRPITRGHTLVVPKRHAAVLDELDPALGGKVFAVAHTLARAVRRSDLAADAANLLINDGRAAFQTVHHVHMHVIPRRHGDLLRFGTGFVLRRLRDADATAETIRTSLRHLPAHSDRENQRGDDQR